MRLFGILGPMPVMITASSGRLLVGLIVLVLEAQVHLRTTIRRSPGRACSVCVPGAMAGVATQRRRLYDVPRRCCEDGEGRSKGWMYSVL